MVYTLSVEAAAAVAVAAAGRQGNVSFVVVAAMDGWMAWRTGAAAAWPAPCSAICSHYFLPSRDNNILPPPPPQSFRLS